MLYSKFWVYVCIFQRHPKSINLIYDKPNLSYGKDKSGVGRRLTTGEHKIEKRKPSAEFSRRNNYWYIAPQKGEHPAVFPEQLAMDHIISWSNKNDIILDPFMGSGTTAKMALLTGRNFIGFELDKTYCGISENRIKSILEEKWILFLMVWILMIVL